MKSITIFIALFIMVEAGFNSCKPDKEEIAVPKTKTELLTAATWKYTSCVISPAYDYYGDGNAVTDIFAIMKDCEKDDFETFKLNGIWEYNAGPTKCDVSEPQIFTEPWSFAANETRLFVGTVECIILELTETTLKLRYSFEDGGITYTEEDTYRH